MKLKALNGDKPRWLPYWFVRVFGWSIFAVENGKPAVEPYAYQLFWIYYGIVGRYEQYVRRVDPNDGYVGGH